MLYPLFQILSPYFWNHLYLGLADVVCFVSLTSLSRDYGKTIETG